MAHEVKQLQTQNLIASVVDKDNTLVTATEEIINTFKMFYQELYTSQGLLGKAKLQEFSIDRSTKDII